MLAGAAGAALVVAAVYVTLPKFSVRDVIVDHVTQHDVAVDHVVPHDVSVDHVVPHDVEIAIPRITQPAPAAAPPQSASRAPAPITSAPENPSERKFEGTPEWKEAVIAGRILRQNGSGFDVATATGEQWSFFPVMSGPDGRIVPSEGFYDDVAGFLGDLARCNQIPNGMYTCVALHAGREVNIVQRPIGAATAGRSSSSPAPAPRGRAAIISISKNL
jgi:hypothetical protein